MGDKPAIVAFARDGARTVSFAELEDRAMRLAGGLAARGLAAGELVGLFAPNGVEWIVARLALIACGAVAVHLDPEWRGERLAHALRLAGTRRVFTTAALAGRLREAAAAPVEIYLLDGGAVEGAVSWTALQGERIERLAPAAPDDEAALFFTSGTTGPPKAVPLTHRNILNTVDTVLGEGLVRAGDRVLLPLPLHHAYPFIVGLLVPIAAGLPLILPAGLSGPELVRALAEGEVTVLVGVPRLLDALAQGIEARVRAGSSATRVLFRPLLALSMLVRARLGIRIGRALFGGLHRRFAPWLRLMASGGARLEADLAQRLEGLGWEVLNGYGLVETASMATFERHGRARPGSAGQAGPQTMLRIAPTAGWEAGSGEVQVKGPLVFPGYRGDEAANRAAFTEDGWLRTGDVGTIDADGFLHIVGRIKEIIVTQGGKKVSPEEVEAVYAESPYIREFAVLEDGNELVGLVVPELEHVRVAGGGRIEDLVRVAIAEQSRHLESHERVTRFAITRETLPRTLLGKIQRFTLPAIYARAMRGEPPPPAELSDDDRRLLEADAARKVFEWFKGRFPNRTVTPDTSPQLDLGIDSLAWVTLGLELEDRVGIGLSEDAIARSVTVRDLMREAVHAAAAGKPAGPAQLDKRQRLMAQADKWIAPQSRLLRTVGLALYAVARPLIRIYFWMRIEGAGNVPAQGPLLIAANHVSDVDPFVIGGALSLAHLSRMAWSGDVEQVFFRPIGRLIARPLRMFPVDDRTPAASLAMAREMLRRGHILVWFPESFRSPDGDLQNFQRGIGQLVVETGAAVVPVWIEGAIRSMSRTGHFPLPVPIAIRFGRPIPAVELTRAAPGEDVPARVASALHDAVAALRDEHRAGRGRS